MSNKLLAYKMTQQLMDYIYDNIQLCVAPDFTGYIFPVLGMEKYILILDIVNPHWTIGKIKSKIKLKYLNKHQYKIITRHLCNIGWIIPNIIEEPFEEFNKSFRINPENIIIFSEEDQLNYSCSLLPLDNIINTKHLGD